MRTKNFLFALTLPILALSSCSVELSEHVRAFLNALKPSQAQSSVDGATYTLKEDYYVRLIDEEGTYYYEEEGRTGGYTEEFSLTFIADQYAYRIEETWDGDAVTEDEDLGFRLYSRTTTLTSSEDGSTWIKTTVSRGLSGQSATSVDEDLLSGNAKDEVVNLLMGQYNDAYSGGLYYGDYLRTYSKNFGDRMSVTDDGEYLVFDPPAQGVSEDSENFYDLMIKVNTLGFMEERTVLAYDETEEQFAVQESSATYRYID